MLAHRVRVSSPVTEPAYLEMLYRGELGLVQNSSDTDRRHVEPCHDATLVADDLQET